MATLGKVSSQMRIPLSIIVAKNNELNRRLDLQIADICSKAPGVFTQRYITQTRSLIAKQSFERLVEAEVIVFCGLNTSLSLQYRYNPDKHKEFKRGNT